MHLAKVALQCRELGAGLAVVIGGQLELAFEIGLYGAQFDILGLEFAFPIKLELAEFSIFSLEFAIPVQLECAQVGVFGAQRCRSHAGSSTQGRDLANF